MWTKQLVLGRIMISTFFSLDQSVDRHPQQQEEITRALCQVYSGYRRPYQWLRLMWTIRDLFLSNQNTFVDHRLTGRQVFFLLNTRQQFINTCVARAPKVSRPQFVFIVWGRRQKQDRMFHVTCSGRPLQHGHVEFVCA